MSRNRLEAHAVNAIKAKLCVVMLVAMTAPTAWAENWYAGAGAGYLDIDLDTTHFNNSTADLFIGYDFNRYFSIELQAQYIETGFVRDENGFRSEFGGVGISPSLVARYPLDESFEVYLRAGASYLDYTIANVSVGGPLDDKTTQPLAGLGIRTNFVFLEYVNYGKIEDMFLEQLRIGIRFEF